MTDDMLLTVEQVAERLQVHEETVRVWIRRKQLNAVQIGNEYRITPADLRDYIERRKTIKPDDK